MGASILLVPESPDTEFSPSAVTRVIRSVWPTVAEHRLGGDPFEVRLEVAERAFNVRVGRRLVSMSPGSTLDDCALAAQRIVQALGGASRFYYMDDGNNHALIIDKRTTLPELAALPRARPLGSP
jgi:hypothetical protein